MEVDESTVVPVVLRPGQASVHHIMTVHASGANNSKLKIFFLFVFVVDIPNLLFIRTSLELRLLFRSSPIRR